MAWCNKCELKSDDTTLFVPRYDRDKSKVRNICWSCHRKGSLVYNKTRRNLVRKFVDTRKDVPCADCGLKYPSYVMEFDHVRGIKSFAIGKEGVWQKTTDELTTEMEKCEVVCANCHRVRTHDRRVQAKQKTA